MDAEPLTARSATALQGVGDATSLLSDRTPQQDATLIVRAIREGWVSDARGRALVEGMFALAESHPEPRTRIAAGRVVAALAIRDIRAEANRIAERSVDVTVGLATARGRIRPADGAAILQALRDQVVLPALPMPDSQGPEPANDS